MCSTRPALPAGTANGAAADKFVAFLASPEAVRIIRAKGMEPG